eukprot:738659-Heterocapsa_arctica.AAC.1
MCRTKCVAWDCPCTYVPGVCVRVLKTCVSYVLWLPKTPTCQTTSLLRSLEISKPEPKTIEAPFGILAEKPTASRHELNTAREAPSAC